MSDVCKHCNLAIYCRACIAEQLRAEPEPLCDFDDCAERPAARRGALRLCNKHAAEHDILEHDALERDEKHVLQHVLEASFDPDVIGTRYSAGDCLAVTGHFRDLVAGVINAVMDELIDLDPHQQLDLRMAVDGLQVEPLADGRVVVYFPGVHYVLDADAAATHGPARPREAR